MSQNRREGGGILWPLKLAPSPPWKFSSYTPAYIPTPQINPQLLEMVMIKIKIDSFPIHILNHCSRPRCNICNVLTYESIGSCFYWVGIQQHFLRTEELTRWKWLFYQILTFSPKLWTRPAYFKVTIMPPKCLETVYIYPSEYTT